MFTGIVQGHCLITARKRHAGVTTVGVDLGPLADDLELGASVALNGTCVSVTSLTDTVATFDMVEETLSLTNLGELNVGDGVNVERSVRVGDEIGGHLLSGHIACTVRVTEVRSSEGHKVVTVAVPPPWLPYLMNKGFIALDGTSLTIATLDRDQGTASVSLIPDTLARTGFSAIEVGDRINLEVDARTQAVVDTVHSMLQDSRGRSPKPD